MAKRKVKDAVRGFAHVVHGTGNIYRGITDPVKPYVDKIVDSAAVFAVGNAALSLGIHYTGEAMHNISNQSVRDAVYDFFDSHDSLDAGVKAITYATVYGLSNWKVILPMAKKVFNRRTNPSWANHAKTWTILGSIGLALYPGGVKEDAEDFYGKLRNSKTVGQGLDTLLESMQSGVAGEYLSGKMAKKAEGYLNGKLEEITQLANNLFLYKTDPEVTERLEEGIEDASRPKPGFRYEDDISLKAKDYVARGLFRTPEELVFLTRVVYFEGGFDSKASGSSQVKRGMDAITSVMYNRWKFDSHLKDEGKSKSFSASGKDMLFDITFRSARNRFGGRTWQFTCIRDHPEYFYNHNGRNGWDIHAEGKLNIGIGRMDRERVNLAYKSVVDVLDERLEDPTNGALFYQNPKHVDKYNSPEEWKRRGLVETARINSHVFYTPKDSQEWREEMDLAEGSKNNSSKSRESNFVSCSKPLRINSKGLNVFVYEVRQGDDPNLIAEGFNECDKNNGEKFHQVYSSDITDRYGNKIGSKVNHGQKVYILANRM